ncbi:tRNA 2-thiouridine(34) synthase MnmA [candidate division KSB1 bacterium]|nr:tRNA 2-thiouridine(34) synthase MnmA [candidate division KSB1 bacterium]
MVKKNPHSVVAVAMSGGLDSSVAALLLKEQGWNVFGITMQQTDDCIDNAERVCRELGIEHHILDLRTDFAQCVIDNFIKEYLAGRTPNPCVLCNKTIKWGLLLDNALKLGASHFATGHYARIVYDGRSKRFHLLKGIDRQKDQSYALWRLDQCQLAKTLFPLGALEKVKVREIAGKYNLFITKPEESQDICFVENDDYKDFILQHLSGKQDSLKPGPIVDQKDNIIGEHKGQAFYTIGQRKGLGVALGKPQYVTEIISERNVVRIGDKSDLLSAGLVASKSNWIANEHPREGMRVMCHIRYNDPGFSAVISKADNDNVNVLFEELRPAVTPGQSAVFYQDDTVIGGGIIYKAIKK